MLLAAGTVGRPHGLDGYFHVNFSRPTLLAVGQELLVGGAATRVLGRKGSDDRPLILLEGYSSRDLVERLRGEELQVEYSKSPSLGPNEWYAEALIGCEIWDGMKAIGSVAALLELPSCEVLEVTLAEGGELLVPMVKDAVKKVDTVGKRIEIDAPFVLGAKPDHDSGSGKTADA